MQVKLGCYSYLLKILILTITVCELRRGFALQCFHYQRHLRPRQHLPVRQCQPVCPVSVGILNPVTLEGFADDGFLQADLACVCDVVPATAADRVEIGTCRGPTVHRLCPGPGHQRYLFQVVTPVGNVRRDGVYSA